MQFVEQKVGDGYTKFLDEKGFILAQVYALTTPGYWRLVMPLKPVEEFQDEQSALKRAREILSSHTVSGQN